MKIPLPLIKSFIETDLSPEKLAEALTLAGIEVDHFDDGELEISLTPNLGHCMSALGIAREIAAHLGKKIALPDIFLKEIPFGKDIKIHDEKLCPHYACALVEGVEGLEVVDVMNLVMMRLGQPLHAFDADLLAGNSLEIKASEQPRKILCLDGVEREVPAGALLIWDEEKPVAIAGIMGAANSAVSEKTTRILIEAAHFDPLSIRNTARAIDCRTESAQRFEKGVDPLLPKRALAEAVERVGGTLTGCKDISFCIFDPKVIAYRPERVNQLLGTKLSETEMEEIFERLEFVCKDRKVQVPSYRFDLSEEIDLVEEIARIYGYNNIEKGRALCSPSHIPGDAMFLFENEMREKLVALGLTEFLNCDLISPKLAELSQHITPSSTGILQAVYAKSEEYSTLRTSLLPALLQSVKTNHDQKNFSIAAFEIGRIHFLSKEVIEVPMAAILLSGPRDPANWGKKSLEADFFDLKGMIETLFRANFPRSNHLAMHPGRQADIQIGDLIVGSLGEIHPDLLQKFGIETRVCYAEMNLFSLMKRKQDHVRCAPLAQFPSSERDWTVSLDLKTPVGDLLQDISQIDSPLLEKAALIDLYLPPAATQKNATIRFTYRDKSGTVLFEEVEKEHGRIIKLLAK